ncbi:MAG: hypothetical protein ACYSVY_28510 [Planctomycetota bacterium]|jgi:hypothetical protein
MRKSRYSEQQIALALQQAEAGALYWYSLYPFHRLVFADMIKEIAAQAVEEGPAPTADEFPNEQL